MYSSRHICFLEQPNPEHSVSTHYSLPLRTIGKRRRNRETALDGTSTTTSLSTLAGTPKDPPDRSQPAGRTDDRFDAPDESEESSLPLPTAAKVVAVEAIGAVQETDDASETLARPEERSPMSAHDQEAQIRWDIALAFPRLRSSATRWQIATTLGLIDNIETERDLIQPNKFGELIVRAASRGKLLAFLEAIRAKLPAPEPKDQSEGPKPNGGPIT